MHRYLNPLYINMSIYFSILDHRWMNGCADVLAGCARSSDRNGYSCVLHPAWTLPAYGPRKMYL